MIQWTHKKATQEKTLCDMFSFIFLFYKGWSRSEIIFVHKLVKLAVIVSLLFHRTLIAPWLQFTTASFTYNYYVHTSIKNPTDSTYLLKYIYYIYIYNDNNVTPPDNPRTEPGAETLLIQRIPNDFVFLFFLTPNSIFNKVLPLYLK